jgi:hypothetical protein
MVDFCSKYQITLGHSTAYYPQGNGLAKSSNKILVNIIKICCKITRSHGKTSLVNALWDDIITTKRSNLACPHTNCLMEWMLFFQLL